MEFLDLPLELIYLVTSFLELDSDISALSQTTRQLHVLLDTCLYSNNVKRYNGCALEWAARLGRLSVAQKLLEAGAPLVSKGTHPISLAACHGHAAVVKLFLEWPICPNGKEVWWPQRSDPQLTPFRDEALDGYYHDPDLMPDKDPIILAIRGGHDSVVQLLHAHGGMAHWDQAKIAKAIFDAISLGYPAIVRFLDARYPETINYMVKINKMLLRMARHTEVARILIEAGVPVDIADSRGFTPLSYAVHSGDEDLVRLLVEAGACPNPVWSNGATLGHVRYSAEQQNLGIVQYLLTYVDVERKISAGGQDLAVLLLVAVICGFEEILEKILMAGYDPNKTCDPCHVVFLAESRTALSWAVGRGDIKTAKLLLEKGADPNKVTMSDEYLLITACQHGNTDLVALLLKHGIDVHCRDWAGTPVLVTAMLFPPIFDMLIDRGADFQVALRYLKSNPTCKSIKSAVRSGNVGLVQKMLDRGVPLDIQETGRTKSMFPLASMGGVAMLQFLYSDGMIALPSEVEAQDAMRDAVRRGDFLTTEYLLNQGFDPNPTVSECGGVDHHSPKSYLGDAAGADDPEAAAATLDALLRYGADIGKLEEPPSCWASCLPDYSATDEHSTDVPLHPLRLLLERGASPLPEDRFGSSILAEAAKRNHKEAIRLLLSYVDKRGLSLNDLHRNLLLVEELSEQWEKQDFQGHCSLNVFD
ncbi:unnamed protein product [Penicillium glandicola]